jgi:hypothetical protein
MSSDPKVILEHRIPARMRELHVFVQLAATLDIDRDSGCMLVVGTSSFRLSKHDFLIDPLADAAALTARSLLQFLGLKIEGNPPTLAPLQNHRKATDLHMKHIGLLSLDANSAVSGWSMPIKECKELLELCFLIGNQVSAHFTTTNARALGASVNQLSKALQLVLDLINREIYVKKGLPPIVFDGSNQEVGQILLLEIE